MRDQPVLLTVFNSFIRLTIYRDAYGHWQIAAREVTAEADYTGIVGIAAPWDVFLQSVEYNPPIRCSRPHELVP